MSDQIEDLKAMIEQQKKAITELNFILKKKDDEIEKKKNIISKQEKLLRFTTAHRNVIQKLLLNKMDET